MSPRVRSRVLSRSPSLGEVREKAEKTLEEAVKQVEEAGGAVAGTHLRMGDPDDEILRHCEEHGDIGLSSWGAGD